MSDATSRFSAVAGQYDAVRPRPPEDLIDVITQWAGVARPDVVDLGAGTGRSALAWAGRASTVTAVEPSAGMRVVAERRIAEAAPESGPGPAARSGTRPEPRPAPRPGTPFTLLDATAEATGLPDGCADVVTASQAMHWFDPDRALPEIARLLRPGGVLAAYDCDWPPCIDWETGAAWARVAALVDEEQARRGRPALHRGKHHLERIRRSGLFRHAELIAVHGREQGDAGRLVAVALSAIAPAAEFLADGCTEEELGIAAFRDVAARRLAGPRTWWWTYQVHLAVR